jgi:hypothetical protein
MRAHLAMQRADVDLERARPVFDAIPVQRSAALRETPRDFGIGRVQVDAVPDGKTLRHEIAPDVVVVGLVEQRAVEIEQNRVDGRPVRPGVRSEGHVGAYHTGSP